MLKSQPEPPKRHCCHRELLVTQERLRESVAATQRIMRGSYSYTNSAPISCTSIKAMLCGYFKNVMANFNLLIAAHSPPLILPHVEILSFRLHYSVYQRSYHPRKARLLLYEHCLRCCCMVAPSWRPLLVPCPVWRARAYTLSRWSCNATQLAHSVLILCIRNCI